MVAFRVGIRDLGVVLMDFLGPNFSCRTSATPSSQRGYKNAPYRNHRPVLHSRQSTTPDMDPIPGPENQNETNERRDHEGTVREAHEGTDTSVLLRQQTTLPCPR